MVFAAWTDSIDDPRFRQDQALPIRGKFDIQPQEAAKLGAASEIKRPWVGSPSARAAEKLNPQEAVARLRSLGVVAAGLRERQAESREETARTKRVADGLF